MRIFENNIIPILIFSVVQCASGMSGSSVYADTGRQIKASMIERQKEEEHNLPNLGEPERCSAHAEDLEVVAHAGHIYLNFSKKVLDKKLKGPFLILRSKGRLGGYQTIAKVDEPVYVDSAVVGNVYDYYYEIQTVKREPVARMGMELQLFGESTFIYGPMDN